jgi:hypothetical protein
VATNDAGRAIDHHLVFGEPQPKTASFSATSADSDHLLTVSRW